MHHLASLNQVAWRPLDTCSELEPGPTYSLIGRNLPDANGQDGETPDEVTVVHSHIMPET